MKKNATKRLTTAVPASVIKQTLAEILPAKAKFSVHVADSGLGNLKVVRVISDAWKSKPVVERLERVIAGVRPVLTKAQNDAILRFSILTPQEWAGIRAPSRRAKTKAGSRTKVFA